MNLEPKHRVTNLDINQKIPINNSLPRDINLTINPNGNNFIISILVRNNAPDLPTLDLSEISGMAEIPISSKQLFRHVQTCREVWKNEVVNLQTTITSQAGGNENSFPFQDHWDIQRQSLTSTSLNNIGQKLAIAGNKLFSQIFQGNQDLKKIGDYLEQSASIRPLVINIISDHFFVPWGMLYTHPKREEKFNKIDGSNFCWQGFWGLTHIIEHKPKRVKLDNQLRLDSTGKISTCINVDNNIDNTRGLKSQPVSDLSSFLNTLTILNLKCNSTKIDFLKTLETPEFAEKILYFFCHGHGAGSLGQPNIGSNHITLTDKEPITDADIEFILKDTKSGTLESNPLVFINACQGGQMTTLFYQTIGFQFLKCQALALIGPQIDVPIVFAAEYARRFFQIFIGSQKPVRIGCLMKRLSNDFLFLHNNPLGLTYSLYHGADCYIDHNYKF